ncbi:MAG: hypothetical protein Q8Q48_02765 [Candidatus Staskawiczbacteria bacterium]|nr:hypothetical protein [Candidatus Staskawiczbacteria bacterium]
MDDLQLYLCGLAAAVIIPMFFFFVLPHFLGGAEKTTGEHLPIDGPFLKEEAMAVTAMQVLQEVMGSRDYLSYRYLSEKMELATVKERARDRLDALVHRIEVALASAREDLLEEEKAKLDQLVEEKMRGFSILSGTLRALNR